MRWLVLVALLPACVFFFGDDDDQCAQQEIAPAPLRNPQTLQCESYGGTCDPACGLACPAVESPVPSWGVCYSSCEQLTQAACAADPSCRVIEDANCAINRSCLTNFLGCFPIDMSADTTIDCWKADAWNCSRSNLCTALHTMADCPSGTCDRPFALCVAEGREPGRCYDPVVCDAAPPACPTGTTPGVSGGCYSGACIPTTLCEQAL